MNTLRPGEVNSLPQPGRGNAGFESRQLPPDVTSDRGKGWVRSGDLLEIRICLRSTESIGHSERGLCLKTKGLGWAR